MIELLVVSSLLLAVFSYLSSGGKHRALGTALAITILVGGVANHRLNYPEKKEPFAVITRTADKVAEAVEPVGDESAQAGQSGKTE
jgi:hypothetical protein